MSESKVREAAATTRPSGSDARAKSANDIGQQIPRYVGCGLAFVAGCVTVFAGRYLVHGASVQLTPEAFLSLVFTIAIGAASVVLAVLAINYGRISERVMTERADRSIDIQMDLFQKSLGLQTQLFDKTMSTLESIGRSTGVTEQRLSDIHSLMQNPTMLKQIAGRAVEQVASEMGKGGREVQKKDDQLEPALAEKLTKNIVRELSARFEALSTPAASLPPLRSRASIAPEGLESRLHESIESLKRRAELADRTKALHAAVQKAASAIPGAKLESEEDVHFWDYLLTYGTKKLALDLRTSRGPVSGDFTGYTRSIEGLVREGSADCLLFVFANPPVAALEKYFGMVMHAFPGKVHMIVSTDASALESQFRAILRVPPAAPVRVMTQGPA